MRLLIISMNARITCFSWHSSSPGSILQFPEHFFYMINWFYKLFLNFFISCRSVLHVNTQSYANLQSFKEYKDKIQEVWNLNYVCNVYFVGLIRITICLLSVDIYKFFHWKSRYKKSLFSKISFFYYYLVHRVLQETFHILNLPQICLHTNQL